MLCQNLKLSTCLLGNRRELIVLYQNYLKNINVFSPKMHYNHSFFNNLIYFSYYYLIMVLRHHSDATECYAGVHGSGLASGATGTPPCWKIVNQDSPRQTRLANHIPQKQWHPTFNREIHFVRQKGIISNSIFSRNRCLLEIAVLTILH